MKNRLALLAFAGSLLSGAAVADDSKLKVLIIDGQNNHNWKATTPVLVEALEETGIYEVEVSTSPPKNGSPDDWAKWRPAFNKADAVLSNYNGQDWPKEVQKSFLDYVSGGGGFVVVHAANNSFGKWKEYNKVIGVGGWGGRKIGVDGPWVHIVDGKMVRDMETKGNGGSHGPRHPFQIIHNDTTHPITKGLPEKWLHQKDELYCKLCGPAENMEVLATAYSSEDNKGTGRHEPMILTIDYGEGRVFHTPMGHIDYSMECVGFIVTLTRGTEWAATGNVSQTEIPADFPTADQVSKRAFTVASK